MVRAVALHVAGDVDVCTEAVQAKLVELTESFTLSEGDRGVLGVEIIDRIACCVCKGITD